MKTNSVAAPSQERQAAVEAMELSQLIRSHKLTQANVDGFLSALKELGAENVADLRWIEKGDLDTLSLKVSFDVQCTIRAIRHRR